MNTEITLQPCPIVEAICEFRLSEDLEPEVFFGTLVEFDKDFSRQRLPVLDLPEHVRRNDPDLRFQPYYEFKKDLLSIRFGPRAVIFSNAKDYTGWSIWFDFICKILDFVSSKDILSPIERIGLRYINFFEINDIIKNSNIVISLNDQDLSGEKVSLRTERKEGLFSTIINIGNCLVLNTPEGSKNGSIIDIDCIRSLKVEETDLLPNYKDIVNEAHLLEKNIFYGIVKEDYISQFVKEGNSKCQ